MGGCSGWGPPMQIGHLRALRFDDKPDARLTLLVNINDDQSACRVVVIGFLFFFTDPKKKGLKKQKGRATPD